MVGRKEDFSFRQLINQYIIIKDDDRNLSVVGTVFQHETRDNAILTYCSVHPNRGIVFEVLAMARITETGIEGADSRIDIREANPETSFQIEYNSIEGTLIEFKPDKDWSVLRDFTNKLEISKQRESQISQEIRDMREIKSIDRFRHEVFPDDLVVIFVGQLPKPEAIWCKGILSDDGEMQGRLLNEPWDSSIGFHEGDVINLELRTVDGVEGLFAKLEDENTSLQKEMSDELNNLKVLLKENPEFSTDSVRFNELVATCKLSDRLKDNLLLCIEDDIVERILELNTYTDDIVAVLAKRLASDCNMNPDQAFEAVLWWMNILELDEAGHGERNDRLQKSGNSLGEELGIDEVGFGVGIYNCLKRAGINTLGDICKLTRNELMGIRNLSLIKVEKILCILAEHGLSLRVTNEKAIIQNKESTLQNRVDELIDELPRQADGDAPRELVMGGIGTEDEFRPRNIKIEKIGLDAEIGNIPIEELGFSVHTCNCLKTAGFITAYDIWNPDDELLKETKNLGRRSLEELTNVLGELRRRQLRRNDAEHNHPGRKKCDQLREIRRRIAIANEIDFEPEECHHTGPCLGTCPLCDAEIQYIDEELQRKKRWGEEIILTGIATEDIAISGCNTNPAVEEETYYAHGGIIDEFDDDDELPFS